MVAEFVAGISFASVSEAFYDVALVVTGLLVVKAFIRHVLWIVTRI